MAFIDAAELATVAALAYYGNRQRAIGSNMTGQVNTDAQDLAIVADNQVRLFGGHGTAQQDSLAKPINGLPSAIPPWIQPPAGRVPIDIFGVAAIGVIGTLGTQLLAFQVPDGYDGVITDYALNYTGGGFVNGSGDLVWRIFADGRAIRNFSNILSEKGSETFPRKISSGIQIYSNQIITVTIDHVANAALGATATCSLIGYMYPRKGSN